MYYATFGFFSKHLSNIHFFGIALKTGHRIASGNKLIPVKMLSNSMIVFTCTVVLSLLIQTEKKR